MRNALICVMGLSWLALVGCAAAENDRFNREYSERRAAEEAPREQRIANALPWPPPTNVPEKQIEDYYARLAGELRHGLLIGARGLPGGMGAIAMRRYLDDPGRAVLGGEDTRRAFQGVQVVYAGPFAFGIGMQKWSGSFPRRHVLLHASYDEPGRVDLRQDHLLVNIAVENKSDYPQNLPEVFFLRDGDRRVYERRSGYELINGHFPIGGRLNPGAVLGGAVLFDVGGNMDQTYELVILVEQDDDTIALTQHIWNGAAGSPPP